MKAAEQLPFGSTQFMPHPLKFSEVRIENTNRCGYRCFFCPREEQTRAQGVMPFEDLALIVDRVGEHDGIVDLHGFGEPLLDKSLVEKIALIKRRWPCASPRFYSTLGVKVGPDYFNRLLECGLKYVEVSFYGFDRESYRQAHGSDHYDLARENLINLCAVRDALDGDCEIVVRAFPKHDKIKQPGTTAIRLQEFREWLDCLGVAVIRERDLHNYGRGRAYNESRDNTSCSVVWGFRRRVLQVTWDLYVIPCCFDFNADVRFGNLRTMTLRDIFFSAEYQQFIQAHVENQLAQYPVCNACERCFRA
jgi:Iron-sulfur cluster-binding domain/Radical SAM superfamily